MQPLRHSHQVDEAVRAVSLTGAIPHCVRAPSAGAALAPGRVAALGAEILQIRGMNETIFWSWVWLVAMPCEWALLNEGVQADRAISTGKLHALLHFHTRPINVVVYHDSQGVLVSRWVSRLDAFSGYPFRT